MKTSRYFLLLIIIGTAFAACTTKSVYNNQAISFATISKSNTYTLPGSGESVDRDEDLLFVDSVSLLIPTYSGKSDVKPLQDSIFKAAFDSTAVDHRALIDAYFSKVNKDLGYNVVQKDTAITYGQADGYEIIRGNVINLTPQLMVYCVTNEYMMPLAAHGMQTKYYINYAIDIAKVINLSDVFTPDGLKSLPEMIAARASDKVAIFGPTEVSGLPSNGNFFISPEGEIVFAYQPYEIASYAQGFINIAFHPYELIKYMKPEAITFFGLSDIAV